MYMIICIVNQKNRRTNVITGQQGQQIHVLVKGWDVGESLFIFIC